MDLVGDTYKLWYRDRDRVNYSYLVSLLLDSNCSAFVGAGLSVHAGYPTFGQLVDYLIQQGGLRAEDYQSLDDLTVKVTKVKETIDARGGGFYELLFRRFDKNHFPLKADTELLKNFVNLPFKSVITTNYDSCIEETANLQNLGFVEIQTFPFLDAGNLEAKKLYYIHGKIYLNDINTSSKRIILTMQDFSRAYSENSPLPGFLGSILDIHNILFLGFAFEERTLFNSLDLSKRRKEFILDFPVDPPKNPPTKFAILPIEQKRIDPILPKEEIEKYLSY